LILLEVDGKCAYSLPAAYFPNKKNPIQMGIKMINMMDHCKITFALAATVAVCILTFAWYTRKQIITGAKNIHTNPNNFFKVFIK
jgi:hypothetical protein